MAMAAPQGKTRTPTSAHLHMHTFVHAHTHTHAHARTHTHVRAHAQTYSRMRTCAPKYEEADSRKQEQAIPCTCTHIQTRAPFQSCGSKLRGPCASCCACAGADEAGDGNGAAAAVTAATIARVAAELVALREEQGARSEMSKVCLPLLCVCAHVHRRLALSRPATALQHLN